jgi:protein TonB
MKPHRTRLAACAAFIVTLVATPGMSLANERVWFRSVDDYKIDAALKVVRLNPASTFTGKLPPMLPAVVVLRVTVDEDGWIRNVWVQRAPEDGELAANIAIDSIFRARTLPRPLNLANSADGSLSYSETFLFNSDNRFQIRTLAPVQTSD